VSFGGRKEKKKRKERTEEETYVKCQTPKLKEKDMNNTPSL